MAGRYGAEVYIRGTVVPLHHSAATLGEDHISIHRGKKHYRRDQRMNRLSRSSSSGLAGQIVFCLCVAEDAGGIVSFLCVPEDA
jgi:hypothetical protein